LAGHGSGLALLPFRAEVAWFREWVWRRAAAFLVLDRRPFFHVAPSGERAPHNCGEAVCLVAYADAEAAVLRGCGLGGEYVETRHVVHAPARSEPRPDLPPDLCSTALDYT
jgi:hypothetical protein